MPLFNAADVSRGIGREKIHAGEMFALEGSEASARLMKKVKELLKDSLGGTDPRKLHETASVAEFNEIKTGLNRKLSDRLAFHEIFSGLLNELGWTERPVFLDRAVLRLNPPERFKQSGELNPLRSFTGVHRDTWGVNIMSQINFWMPIFPVSPENTFAFYPGHWNRPIKNNTAEWSFSEYLERKSEGYPTMPEALEKVSGENPVPALPEPGQMLIFSAAHLHGSLPNLSESTRVNLETRCYFECDESRDLGAPNADTRGREKARNLFAKLKSNPAATA